MTMPRWIHLLLAAVAFAAGAFTVLTGGQAWVIVLDLFAGVFNVFVYFYLR